MKVIRRRSGTRRARVLVMIPVIFVAMSLYREFVLSFLPGLDTWYIEAVVAGVVSVVAWWIASCGRSSR